MLCWKIWELSNKEKHDSMEDLPGGYRIASPVDWSPPVPGFINNRCGWCFTLGTPFFSELALWHAILLVNVFGGHVSSWLVVLRRVMEKLCPFSMVRFLLVKNSGLMWSVKRIVYPSFALSRESCSLVSFGALLDTCLALHLSFQSLSFSFVKRSGNNLAHVLATASTLAYNKGVCFPSHLIS